MFFVKEGILFIFIPIILGIFPIVFGDNIIWKSVGFTLIFIGLFCSYFFRDPKRKIITQENIVLSPGDGRVLELGRENSKNVIRIFLSVFNVHLQRAPVSGSIKSVQYYPGKFLPAMKAQAHALNEQNVITIQNHHGEFMVKQIAGILARRVVSWVKPDQKISIGQKIGFIRFGSQVDLYIPQEFEIKVKEGDKVTAGITIVAELK